MGVSHKLKDVEWSEHPLGLASDRFIGTGIGCDGVSVGNNRNRLGIEPMPQVASYALGREPWGWRPWVEAWGRDRVLAYLAEWRPDMVATFRRHEPFMFVGWSLDERAANSAKRKAQAARREAGLSTRPRRGPRVRAPQPKTSDEKRFRIKFGVTMTPEERAEVCRENLKKALAALAERSAKTREARRTAREEAAARRKAERRAVREAEQKAAKKGHVRSLPSGTKHKPRASQKPQFSPPNKEKWSGHEPFTEREVVVVEQKREAMTVEEFIRTRGVTVLAPAGSGAKVGTVVGVRK